MATGLATASPPHSQPPAKSGEISALARHVTYLGHNFTVPAGWHLVDLATDPTACVRFDAHAVYLGSPSTDQQCAAQGNTAVTGAVLIEPSPTARTTGATDDAVGQRISATLPGIAITASYGTDRSRVLALLSAAGVPTPTATNDTGTTAAVAAHIAASLTPISGPVNPAVVATMTHNFTGPGFDPCTTPSTTQMTAWGTSPFAAIGVYIGGAGRACAQPNLTATWISAETSAGWHLIPLYVGPQIAYNTITNATAQGTSSAQDAATQASALGIGTGALLYYDMEGGTYTAAQTTTAQAFLSAWTTQLHTLGYLSAVYGSETGAVGAAVSGWGTMTEPDDIDVENWNGLANDDPGADPAGHWNGHRVHQFLGAANATYGGVTINIDQDYLGLGWPCSPTPSASPGAVILPQYRTNCAAGPMPAPSAS
jgi:hypothetical protein